MRGLVGMDRTFCGMGADGSESVRGRVGMGVKSAGIGEDGTKITSTPDTKRPCCLCRVWCGVAL